MGFVEWPGCGGRRPAGALPDPDLRPHHQEGAGSTAGQGARDHPLQRRWTDEGAAAVLCLNLLPSVLWGSLSNKSVIASYNTHNTTLPGTIIFKAKHFKKI